MLGARVPFALAVVCMVVGAGAGACSSSDDGKTSGSGGSGAGGADGGGSGMAQALFVAHQGTLISYDVVTGRERAGALQNVASPTDIQALADGTVLVNLTERNEVLVVNGKTMLEIARIPSSAKGAVRPVHSYISPSRKGKSYWIALNDGEKAKVETNSARFIDVTPGSATYLKAVGEVGLGVGHHKGSFSVTQERVVFSNIGDCDNVMSVYDYSDIGNIKPLAKLSAADAGYDGSSRAKTCDPTYKTGAPPAPHGCATSKVSKKAYCSLTSSGDLVAIDIDATPPTFKLIKTGGNGGGYTKTLGTGKYVYTLQETPREGSKDKPAPSCQTGQLVVVDATTDTVAKDVPIFYKGPGCKDVLKGTDEETADAGHMLITADDTKMYVSMGGGFGVDTARTRQEVVFDLTNPASPVQLASIPVGVATSHRGDALSGDGKWVFVANNVDGTVTKIDAASGAVAATIQVKNKPLTLATFGDAEGPSAQTGPIK